LISEEMKQVVELFDKGRQLYKLMKFKEAKVYFQKAMDIKPGDGPAQVYLERCDHYIKNPPPPDWDGVFVMTTK
jgi:hypothetical protein